MIGIEFIDKDYCGLVFRCQSIAHTMEHGFWFLVILDCKLLFFISLFSYMIDTKKLTLWTWVFLSGLHFIRAFCIAIMPTALQNFLNWILGLHMLQPYLIITSFDLGKMLMLVVVTFAVGCFLGWIFSLIANAVVKK